MGFVIGFIICFTIFFTFTVAIFAICRILSDWLILGIIFGWSLMSYYIIESGLTQQLSEGLSFAVGILMFSVPGIICFPLIPNTNYFNKLTKITVLLLSGKLVDNAKEQIKEIWNEGRNEKENLSELDSGGNIEIDKHLNVKNDSLDHSDNKGEKSITAKQPTSISVEEPPKDNLS